MSSWLAENVKRQYLYFPPFRVRCLRKSFSGHSLTARTMEQKHQWPWNKEHVLPKNSLEKLQLNGFSLQQGKPVNPWWGELELQNFNTIIVWVTTTQNVQFSTKIIKHTKKLIKCSIFKKQKNLTEIIPEEAQTFNLLVKNIKSTFLNMLNQLKEIINKKPKEIKKQYQYKMRVQIKINNK